MTSRIARPHTSHVLLAVGLTLGVCAAHAGAQSIDPDRYSQLRYRHIGPVGNRFASVAGVVGDRLTYYAGAASGGIWKSVDGGEYWEPIFDGQVDHSIGALAVAPSDPSIVWAGTGEPHIRSNVSVGTGVYKSTDGGETWTHMGLGEGGPTRTSRIVIHPTNPDIVYVGALGHAHGPQRARGVFRTMDGGETWEHVLFVDESTGASSVEMDPSNPRKLWAGMWTVQFNTWGRESGGEGSGIYLSLDGGDSWTKLEGNGLPVLPVGKTDICLTPADADRVYALIETGDGVPWHGRETESGEAWRSDDGGESWQLLTHERNRAGRTGYYNNCFVSTDDPDEVYFLHSSFMYSIDGGFTADQQGGPSSPGGDHHDMWIDPLDGDRMIVGNDQGLGVSTNRGRTWHRVELPVGQMYHVTVDDAIPYNVLGNRQDGPSFRGPSNVPGGGRGGGPGIIPRGAWLTVGGGESGFATPDPEDPNIVWSSASGSGARGGVVVVWDARNRQFRDVEVWPRLASGHPASGVRYRFQWTFPLHLSPHDRNTVYVTSQHVHRTTNGGQSWDVISPDLSTNDESRMGISGGLTPDNIGVEFCCVIYAFAESPVEEGVLWVGTNDGLAHVTRDGGATWTEITGNFPDLPPDGVVRGIHASKHTAGKAYYAIEHHQVGNFEPHVYKTEDYGRSFTKIVDGIADSPLSYVRDIYEDPVRPGLLYLGTENILYVSFDDGGRWQPLMNNMPPAPMYGIEVQERFNDLVVGTYGRGFWILDDITPLQQLTPDVVASSSHLFEPRDAYRFRSVTSYRRIPNDQSDGDNPQSGASINYWVSNTDAAGATLRIADASGRDVRTLRGPADAGINRVWWNLRDEASPSVALRTKPLYADWYDLGSDRRRGGGGGLSMLVAPGTYTVTLDVGGATHTQQLRVLKDPNSGGSEADIRAQLALFSEIRADHAEAAGMVNRIEWARRQLYDLNDVLESRGDATDVLQASAELDEKLIATESEMVQLLNAGSDGTRWAPELIQELSYLAGNISGSDFRPTDQAREVQTILHEEVVRLRGEVDRLFETDVAAFNQALLARDLAPLITDRE
jgi:photosystem II stability/assembly factor-like uncharacterized protein